MIRYKALDHRFVDSFPDTLAPGILYVSLEYGSAAHSCCCGCGEEVVTPLTPTDWHITYDGETITLHPSIGNWTLLCRSHYVIRRNRVIEAPSWSDSEVAAERRRDRQAKARYFGQQAPGPETTADPERPIENSTRPSETRQRWWEFIASWWRKIS